MPNHFLVTGLCGRDYENLERAGLEPDDIDFSPLVESNLCDLISPLPGDLQGIVASTPPCRYINKVTREAWTEDCNGPWGKGQSKWHTVPLTTNEITDLRIKHGADNWFDWQTKNWGTKWGTYNVKAHELGGDGSPILIEFQSAWTPPSPKMMGKIDAYVCEEYHLQNIKWTGHNPSDNSTMDIEVAYQ